MAATTYDNPAGRLYGLLAAIKGMTEVTTLSNAWANALEIEETELPLRLADVARLIPDLQKAVDRAGDDVHTRLVTRHRSSWANLIFPFQHPFGAMLKDVSLPSDDAMDALASLSSHLHHLAPDGRIPSVDEVEKLREQIDTLRGDITASDLPDDVKALVLLRLEAIADALAHLSVTGPGGVRSAIEALIGTAVVSGGAEKTSAKSSAWKGVWTVVAVACTLFMSGPGVQASIEAWPQVAQHVLSIAGDDNQAPAVTTPTGKSDTAGAGPTHDPDCAGAGDASSAS